MTNRTEYLKKYLIEHRESHLASMKKYRINKRKSLIDKLGGKCGRCGFSDWRALQVDHKNGDGADDRKIHKGRGPSFHKIVLGNREKYQLLCANCNWIKRYEDNECAKPLQTLTK